MIDHYRRSPPIFSHLYLGFRDLLLRGRSLCWIFLLSICPPHVTTAESPEQVRYIVLWYPHLQYAASWTS